MAVTGIGGSSALSLQAIAQMRSQLDDLQRQLGTGKKSDTYAGLGLDRGLTVGLALAPVRHLRLPGHHHPGRRAARPDADRADAVHQRFAADQEHDPAIAVRAGRRQPDRRTRPTPKARSTPLIGMLNTSADGRYLFSGRTVDQAPVETTDHILNGDGLKAGLKQVINERRQADLGTSGLGRLVVGAPARQRDVADRGRRVAVRLQACRRHHRRSPARP